jgi:hypothetical protein
MAHLAQAAARAPSFWAPIYWPVEAPNCDLDHLAFRKPVACLVCFEGVTAMKKILVLTALVLFLVAHGAVTAMTMYSPLDVTDACAGSGC